MHAEISDNLNRHVRRSRFVPLGSSCAGSSPWRARARTVSRATPRNCATTLASTKNSGSFEFMAFSILGSRIWPLQANKKHSFHSWRRWSVGRCCQSPERSGAGGRGSEHGAGLLYAPRRAAQAGLTGGADRSSRLRRGTNVAAKDQPKG